MNKSLFTCCFILFLISSLSAQKLTLKGKVIDDITHEALIGATIRSGDQGTITDYNGSFTLTLATGDQELLISYIGYETLAMNVFIKEGDNEELLISLSSNPTLLSTATVTSSKYSKPLSEVTVSLDILKPALVEAINSTSIDEVLTKVTGVDFVDGQANIRGGSGFAYGAGSRVLLLMDDIPILQPDAGFPYWDDIPVENIEQIEVVKGAASALYGSSAMNGIINIRTAYAKSTPETRISTSYQVYNAPREIDQKWWDKTPFQATVSFAHRQKFNKTDMVLGAYYLYRDSYNKDFYYRYGRVNGGIRHRFNDNLVFGFNTNINPGRTGSFFYWNGLDSLYVSSSNTITTSDRFRFNIDPFLTYHDDFGNSHKFTGRFYYIDNDNSGGNSNKSQTGYGEYQFHKHLTDYGLNITAGLVFTGNKIEAELYGDTIFRAQNIASYAQLDKKLFDKLNISAGFRYEHNTFFTPEYFSYTNRFGQEIIDTIPDGRITESRPVLRFGLNYEIADFTFLRASWGQGYRFPTLAESFIKTQFGGTPIVPNPSLNSETGWSSELGLKQGFKIGSFNGFLDASIFWSKYQDMIEFNATSSFEFIAINIGDTDIKGTELSVMGQGELMGIPLSIVGGYTYIIPKFQAFDTSTPPAGEPWSEGQFNAAFSSYDKNILKYRFEHTWKFDVQGTYKRFTLGLTGDYKSHMKAVDLLFETFVIPGLKEYREENNKGIFVAGARLSYDITKVLKGSLLVNNLSNKMYSYRVGLMEAPRTFALRLDAKF